MTDSLVLIPLVSGLGSGLIRWLVLLSVVSLNPFGFRAGFRTVPFFLTNGMLMVLIPLVSGLGSGRFK